MCSSIGWCSNLSLSMAPPKMNAAADNVRKRVQVEQAIGNGGLRTALLGPQVGRNGVGASPLRGANARVPASQCVLDGAKKVAPAGHRAETGGISAQGCPQV
jgi:hypothetical protein